MNKRKPRSKRKKSKKRKPIRDVDLAALAKKVNQRLGSRPLPGYIAGKTIIRDGVISILGCSYVVAERITDTLEQRGWIRFPRGDRPRNGRWEFTLSGV